MLHSTNVIDIEYLMTVILKLLILIQSCVKYSFLSGCIMFINIYTQAPEVRIVCIDLVFIPSLPLSHPHTHPMKNMEQIGEINGFIFIFHWIGWGWGLCA